MKNLKKYVLNLNVWMQNANFSDQHANPPEKPVTSRFWGDKAQKRVLSILCGTPQCITVLFLFHIKIITTNS